MEVLIPAADFAGMAAGVPYTLHPANRANGYVWKVRPGLTVTLQPTLEERFEAMRRRVEQLEKRLEALEKTGSRSPR